MEFMKQKDAKTSSSCPLKKIATVKRSLSVPGVVIDAYLHIPNQIFARSNVVSWYAPISQTLSRKWHDRSSKCQLWNA